MLTPIYWWPWRLHFQVLDQIHLKRHNPGISKNRHNLEWQPWHPKKIRSFLGHFRRNLRFWMTLKCWVINYESLFMTKRRYFLRFEILVYMLPRKNTSVHNLVIIKNDYDSILNNNHYQCIDIAKSFGIFETLETKSQL